MQKLSIPSRHTSEVQPLLHPFAPAITYPAPSSCTLLKPSTQFVRVLIAVTMAEGGPALPWAAQAAPAPVEEENDDDAPAKALSLEELALKVGTKVEVKWEILDTDSQQDEDAEPKGSPLMRWWGATITGPGKDENGAVLGPNVYELLYDPYEDFTEERSNVKFTGDHTLEDLGVENELVWRKEGDAWDEPADEETVDPAVTIEQLKATMAAIPQVESEALEKKLLGSLEPHQQRAMAEGYRNFADGFKAFVEKKVGSANGAETTITKEDIAEFAEQITKKPRVE